jgi:NTE family protein
VERLEAVNRMIENVPPERRDGLKAIPTLVLRPSRDLGQLAADQYRRFPRFLRYVLSGIGAQAESGSDLLSYLAFEPVYVGRLLELGYDDTIARRAEILEFFGEERREKRSMRA